MDELPVTVTILGRKYKLKISSSEEPYLRKAADLIEQQARDYGKRYGHQDGQDLLAMVSLTQITSLIKMQERRNFQSDGLEERLNAISQLLDRAETEG
jgi:cell division protein ZapA (FtsZ GTPase activity inhibitor)